MALTETAVERYKGLLTLTVPAFNAQLQTNALREVIEGAAVGGAPVNPAPALSTHVAVHSQLTEAQAQPLVAAALATVPAGNDTQKAAAVSQAVAGALPGVSVELSEAVMLNGTARLCFAIGFNAILVGCIVGVVAVGAESNPSETVMITLSAIAVLVLVGVLVLVMGYKTAKIKLGS